MGGILASGEGADMGTLTTGITNLMSLVNTVISAIVANPWLVIIFAAGFVSLAVKIWRKMAKGAKIGG